MWVVLILARLAVALFRRIMWLVRFTLLKKAHTEMTRTTSQPRFVTNKHAGCYGPCVGFGEPVRGDVRGRVRQFVACHRRERFEFVIEHLYLLQRGRPGNCST